MGRGGWRILAIVMAVAPAGLAQGPGMGGSGVPTMQGEPGANGFGFYGVAAYAGYTSTTVPFNATLPVSGLNLGPNYLAGGSASAGWQDYGARTDAHVSYTISYDASLRYSTWNSLNHHLVFGVSHSLSPRWTYSIAGSAATMRWDQFLFEPTALTEVASVPATFDELVSAILNGTYTNSQLASILTGAPTLDSPAATYLYGTRFFTSSLRNQLTYDVSPRMHIYAGLGGMRTQTISSDRPEIDGAVLVPSITSANATTGLTYALSPVSTIGVEAQASRTFSRFEDAYTATGALTAGRAFGRHWLLTGRAGAGTYFPVRQTFRFRTGPQWVASGGITYKGSSQMVMLAYARTIEDTTGLGAQSTGTASAAWEWHRPGLRWATFSQARYTNLSGSSLSNVNAWIASAGIIRFDRHTTVRLGYVYGRDAGIVNNSIESRQLQAANLVISWTPHAMPY